jgi:tetratricopeptide (TPR) repeat protein
LFARGQCYYELNQSEKSLKILIHLRADPTFGPSASLFAGTLHMKVHRAEDAAMDFEIGLRHENIKQETKIELKYRLANTYAQMQNVGEALRLFEELHREQPGYWDVESQMGRYRELSLNTHLQTYLLGGTSEFVTLCRKLASMFFPQAVVKVVDISVNKNDYADILAEVSTDRWDDVVLYRFLRSSSRTGDLSLRDMHARIKEVKAGRGFCVNAGGFSETAQQFVEARLIDLVDKEPLIEMFNRITTWAPN